MADCVMLVSRRNRIQGSFHLSLYIHLRTESHSWEPHPTQRVHLSVSQPIPGGCMRLIKLQSTLSKSMVNQSKLWVSGICFYQMKVSRFCDSAKYRLKSILPYSVWTILSTNFQKKRANDFAEHKIVRRQGRTLPRIYIIRRRPPGGGLFSNVNHVLQGIEYANDNSLTPVVDMQNYWTSYSQQKPFHNSDNAWEYFFEPISKFKVDDIATFQDVTLSK